MRRPYTQNPSAREAGCVQQQHAADGADAERWGIGGVVILLGKLTIETMSAIAWVDVGFAVIFTLIWGYYLLAKPTTA